MHVGITYDLKDDYLARGYDSETCAEFDSPETIDAIDAFLQSRGCKTERIGNIHALNVALAAGKRWDLVFNIAEGLHGRGREAQVPALLDAYQIPYVFSDPLVLSLTLDKALTKRVMRDGGIPTASFHVVEPHDAIAPSLPFPLFVKPVAEGTGKGITNDSLVKNTQEYQKTVKQLLVQFGQPVLVEQYLPGREFTVGITGTGAHARVVGVMEILLLDNADSCGYTYDNKKYYEERVRYKLVDDSEAKEAGAVALAAWNLLGCRDGGRIDIRSDANHKPHCIEVNPLAGLHPVLGDLVILSKLAGITYHALLNRILDSALSDFRVFLLIKHQHSRLMLSLEKIFREKLAENYRTAPIDLKSFHRKYKVCTMADCAGLCCNGGSGFYITEESDTIRELTVTKADFFAKQGIPQNLPFFSTEIDEETGAESLSTGIRDTTYPAGLLPPHFPSTCCIFKRDDGACTLQVLSIEEGKPSWWYKPLACWMFPLELEHDGKPHIHVAHHSTDEYIDEEYAGFTGYTKCGAECPSDGKPAYEVLKFEIAQISKILERDLMSEILAYKEAA